MRISQEIREAGMREKSREFKESGGEIYLKEELPAPSAGD
jgi:hypothetical protein